MSHRIRRHLSFANVASLSALVFAMGGTSYAVSAAKNSVGSAQIKSGAVKNSDLGSNAVTSAKVKNGALRAVDFAANQLPRGATGAPGLPGAAGAKGDKGDKGDKGAFGAVTAYSLTAAADMTANQKLSFTVSCPAGQQAIGGGGRGDDSSSELTNVSASRPALSTTAPANEPPADGQGFDGWRITVKNEGANPSIRPTVWVFCVPAAS